MIGLVRAFVAIELPLDIRDGLAILQRGLQQGGQDIARWVSPDGMHLTLKFLGVVREQTVTQAERAVQQAAQGIPPFRLETDGINVFPDTRRPRVLIVSLKGDLDVLEKLYQGVEQEFSRLGFETEARAFTPHLTLARMREEVPPAQRQRFVEDAMRRDVPSRSFVAEGLSLMRSSLSPKGATYSRMALAPFQKTI